MNLIVKTMPLHMADDSKITISLIAARCAGKPIFVRRRGFDTWEMPGGHREGDESVLDCAKRELFEETGAAEYRIAPVCAYTVNDNGNILYGALFVADVERLGELPASEIEEVRIFDSVPDDLTFPIIQAKLSVISLPHELCGGVGKNVSIRRAQYIDISDICELYRPAPANTGDEDTDEIIRIESEFRMRTTEHLLRTTIEKPNKRVFMAYDGIRPIGVCELRLLSKPGARTDEFDGGDIVSLTVLDSHARSGIGKHLTDCAITFMRSIACSYAIMWIPAADEELSAAVETQGFTYDGTREMTDSGTKLRYRMALA